MIRSGLVNQERARFEKGFPHERESNQVFIRPYVSISDPTVLKRSGFFEPQKVIVPSPVTYNDIFTKKATPDERLYILRQIQQGFSKMGTPLNNRVGIVPEAKPLPSEIKTEQPASQEQRPPLTSGPAIPVPTNDDLPELLNEDLDVDLFDEEMEAEDVVYPAGVEFSTQTEEQISEIVDAIISLDTGTQTIDEIIDHVMNRDAGVQTEHVEESFQIYSGRKKSKIDTELDTEIRETIESNGEGPRIQKMFKKIEPKKTKPTESPNEKESINQEPRIGHSFKKTKPTESPNEKESINQEPRIEHSFKKESYKVKRKKKVDFSERLKRGDLATKIALKNELVRRVSKFEKILANEKSTERQKDIARKNLYKTEDGLKRVISEIEKLQ